MHHLKFKFTGSFKVFTQYALILRRSVLCDLIMIHKCRVFLTVVENSILSNKIHKRHFRHEFYVRHERSVAERVFNKQVSRDVYKRVEYTN
jgi:hypothetical protein